MLPIQEHLKLYQDYLIITNHPVRTQKCYISHLKNYLEYCYAKICPDPFLSASVQKYIIFRFQQDLDWKTVNLDYSAIKKYFVKVQNIEWDVAKLPRPKRKKELPDILSQHDIMRLIEHSMQLKIRVMILFIYGTGMRLSEILGVQVNDIDSNRLQIRVQLGKGQKSRYVEIPMELIEILRSYYKVYRPSSYLFYGAIKELPVKERTFQHAIKTAGIRAGINRDVNAHTLRHCYATHHMDNGTNIVYIQKMLGHSSLKTTSIYLHLCVNPRGIQIHHPIQNLKFDLMKNTRI